ncbi:MAG: phosphodiesterase [Betaproteobacteria bacterium]|nr:MAG: phosphodiesterase [Betaproteobacteria bacterium]
MLPNYSGGSLVNLVASIVQARGGEPRHPVLAALPAAELSEAENIVLVIIDGLGDHYLARCGAGGELARRRRASITSVFPSTTASAITTSYTGRTPLEHGLTGWFTYFGAAGCVASPLQFRSRGENLPLQQRGFSPGSAFPAPSVFESLPVRSIVVTPRQIADSAYNVRHCAGATRLAYETLEEFVSQVEAAVKSGAQRKFIYAYWPHYDVISHRHGSESRQAAAELEKFDHAFGSLIARLSATQSRIVATADHGFIDVAQEESLELPAELAAMLRFPLCGERRVAYCYVHSPAQFMDRARHWLGDRADVRPSRELLREGWFGPGTPHPRIDERVGDVALVMRGRYTVKDWTPGEPRHLHIGNHGGTSEDEMMIPLIVETT